MDYLYSFLAVYVMLMLYAFLMEVVECRSPWKFIIIFSLMFPVLLIIYSISEFRQYKRRRNGLKQNQNP